MSLSGVKSINKKMESWESVQSFALRVYRPMYSVRVFYHSHKFCKLHCYCTRNHTNNVNRSTLLYMGYQSVNYQLSVNYVLYNWPKVGVELLIIIILALKPLPRSFTQWALSEI